MIKVVFVGDEPSTMNMHPSIAFVGAKCFQKLTTWIKTINPDYYICFNSNNIETLEAVEMLSKHEFKVIALGSLASQRLTKMNVHHFSLPHPSGLNRQNNDNNKLAIKLAEANEYVRESV